MSPLATICTSLGLGLAAFLVAPRLRVPPIVPLLFFGMLSGPALLGLVHPSAIGPANLKGLVLGAVLIILFEGSLSLRLETLRSHGGPITKLITVGAVVTWVGAALAAHFVLGVAWRVSIIIGAVLIVTGPTVVIPLLRAVRPNTDLREILRWEGILIDPVGAIAAIVVFEFIDAGASGSIGLLALDYLKRSVVGIAAGFAAGYLVDRGLRARQLVPQELTTPFALGVVLLGSVLAERLAHESSLFAAPIAGVVLAKLKPPRLADIERFNGELTTALLAVLFVLLAADVDPRSILGLGWRGAAFLVALQVVRFACVVASTTRASLSWPERLFLAWLAPRGVVAASVASVFGTALVANGLRDAEKIVPVIFLVIVGTVLVQGLLARPIGAALGVLAPPQRNVLIAGASAFSAQLAKALEAAGIETVVVDRSRAKVDQLDVLGVIAYEGDVLAPVTYADIDLEATGAFLAATPNDEVNSLASHLAAEIIGRESVLQLPSGRRALHMADASAAVGAPLAFGTRFTLRCFDDALRQGAQIVVKELAQPRRAAQLRADLKSDFRPLIAIEGKAGRPRFVREENAHLGAGRVVGIEKLPAELLSRPDASPIDAVESTRLRAQPPGSADKGAGAG